MVSRRFQDDHIITITLEDGSGTTFRIQKALLCSASQYFVKALQGSFKESDEHALRLPGCDADTFRLFLYWLCHGRLPEDMKDKGPPGDHEERDMFCRRRQELFIRLWCFADAYLLPKIQNEAMRAFLDHLRSSRVRIESVRLAFELASEHSPLHSAVMNELIYDCGRLAYNVEDMDYLGTIAGLMYKVVAKLRASLDGTEESEWKGTSKNDIGEYMVPE